MIDEQKTLAAITELFQIYRKNCIIFDAMTREEWALLHTLQQFKDTIESLAARSVEIATTPHSGDGAPMIDKSQCSDRHC